MSFINRWGGGYFQGSWDFFYVLEEKRLKHKPSNDEGNITFVSILFYYVRVC